MFHGLSKYISSQHCDVLSVDDFIEHNIIHQYKLTGVTLKDYDTIC